MTVTRFAGGAAIAGVLLYALACGGEAPSAPSGGSRGVGVIALNDTVNRTIAARLESDTLAFTAVAGQRIHVDVQQLAAGFAAQALTYAFVDSATGAVIDAGEARLPSLPLGFDVADIGLSWRRLATAGKYFLITSSRAMTRDSAYVGAYRARLVGSNPAPETAAAQLRSGDSLTESLDVADVDEFGLIAAKGSQLYVFLKAETGRGADTLIAETAADGIYAVRLVASPGDDSTPDGAIGGFAPTSSDTTRIRVRATSGATVGKYQLKFYQLDRRPEGISSALVAGDTIQSSIEYPGDIDEFTFVGEPGQWYSVAVQPVTGRPRDALRFQVSRPDNPDLFDVTLKGTAPELLANMSRRFQGGTTTLIRVLTEDGVSRGAYRLAVAHLNPLPETGSATFAIGDTVTGSIEIPADFDEFTFHADSGESLVLYLQAGGTDTSASIRLIADSLGNPTYGLPIEASVSDPRRILRQNVSELAVVRKTGSYVIRADGVGGYRSTYRFAVVHIDPGPEGAPTVVQLEEPLSAAIDPPGDLDRFTFNGVAGQTITAFMQVVPPAPGAAADGGASLGLISPSGTWALTAVGEVDSLGTAGSDLMSLPETGSYKITVVGGSSSGSQVPYKVLIHQLNVLPEIVPANIHVGDRITAEPIWPANDWDDFHLSAPAGTRFKACLLNRGDAEAARSMVLFVSTAATVASRAGDVEPTCTEPSAIDASGSALVSVSGGSWAVGPYDLEIIAAP